MHKVMCSRKQTLRGSVLSVQTVSSCLSCLSYATMSVMCLSCAPMLVMCHLQVDWKSEENRPVKPKLLGTKVYKDYAVKDILDYIDWNPFFQVCCLHVCLVMTPSCLS